MAGWHHQLDGREFEWTLGVGDGQGGLECCDSWGRKESDMTEYWTELNWTDIKGETDSNTIIVGDLNTPLTPKDRSSKQKLSKETQVLNDTLDQIDFTDIFRTFHPNAEKYTIFSSAPGTFSRIDHILGDKSNLSKFKKIEIISSIFFDHNTMRLDINYKKKKTVRNTNTWD